MFPTQDEIIDLILVDYDAIKDLPKSMLERALYARNALQKPDEYDIRFGRYGGEIYTFAVFDEASGTWLDITGHYHTNPPDEVTIKRAEKTYAKLTHEKAIQDITTHLHQEYGLPPDLGKVRLEVYLSRSYHAARADIPRVCTICGATEQEYGKTFHFHHLNTTLSSELRLAREAVQETRHKPEIFAPAYENYLFTAIEYYSVDITETTLLCPSCHRRTHREAT